MLILGILGQWCGMAAVLGGIIYELHSGAHIGWAIISLGSLLYAISTKIVHRKR